MDKLIGVSLIPSVDSCEGSGECDDCEISDCYYNEGDVQDYINHFDGE